LPIAVRALVSAKNRATSTRDSPRRAFRLAGLPGNRAPRPWFARKPGPLACSSAANDRAEAELCDAQSWLLVRRRCGTLGGAAALRQDGHSPPLGTEVSGAADGHDRPRSISATDWPNVR
jgi:hypothetical protein